MAHAHLSREGPSLRSSPTERHSTSSSPQSKVLPTLGLGTPNKSDYLNDYGRRLQLRNAGFRAAVLPSRRISPPTASFGPQANVFRRSPPVNTENRSLSASAEKRVLSRDIGSPSGVLEEINNSARLGRTPRRPTLCNIFQEPSNDPPSWLHTTNLHSPRSPGSELHGGTVKMSKAKSSAARARTPPRLGSPLDKHTKSHIRRPSSMSRQNTFDSDKYIEYLESELTLLNAKFDSLTPSKSSRNQASRIRALTKQVQSLRKELVDWESKFEERVEDEVFKRTLIEVELKSRIEVLKGELEAKETRIRDLEQALEKSYAQLGKTESAEISLGRRVDVLTELLAQSPTRIEMPNISDFITPKQGSPRAFSRQSPHRAQSSPTARRRSNSISIDSMHNANYDRGLLSSTAESPASTKSPASSVSSAEDCHKKPNQEFAVLSSIENESILAPEQTDFGRLFVADQVTSEPSYSAINIPSAGTKGQSRSKKMRRFARGSTSLKPLILPTSAALAQASPFSAPVQVDYAYPFAEQAQDQIDYDQYLLDDAHQGSFSMQQPGDTLNTEIVSLSHSSFDLRREELEWSMEGNANTYYSSTLSFTEVGNGPERSLAPSPVQYSLQVELARAETPETMPEGRLEASSLDRKSGDNFMNFKPSWELQVSKFWLRGVWKDPSSFIGGCWSILPWKMLSSFLEPLSILQTFWNRCLEASSTAFRYMSASCDYLACLVRSSHRRTPGIARMVIRTSLKSGQEKIIELGRWLIRLVCKNERSRGRLGQISKNKKERWTPGCASSQRRTEAYCNKFLHQEEMISIKQWADEKGGSDFPEVISIQPNDDTLLYGHSELQDLQESVLPPEPRRRHSIALWCKFTFALVLAIGLAVTEGPGSLILKESCPKARGPDDRSQANAVDGDIKDSTGHSQNEACRRWSGLSQGMYLEATDIDLAASIDNGTAFGGSRYRFVRNPKEQDIHLLAQAKGMLLFYE